MKYRSLNELYILLLEQFNNNNYHGICINIEMLKYHKKNNKIRIFFII